MPTFFPRIPVTLAISFSVPSLALGYWLGSYDLSLRSLRSLDLLFPFYLLHSFVEAMLLRVL
jgi:hypothetical protein